VLINLTAGGFAPQLIDDVDTRHGVTAVKTAQN
jgi:hypothetical protein